MTAPDVRTATQAEADSRWPRPMRFDREASDFEHDAFVAGAVWGAALVTPTREQIAEVIARSLDPEYGIVDEVDLIAADAVLALMQASPEKSG